MLASLCGWLEKTPLSTFVQDAGWVIPLCQIVHILCLAAVMFSMLFLDVRVLTGAPRRVGVQALARRFLPPVWTAVPLMALSGAVLIIGEPRRDLLNPVFQLKMLLLVLALALTFALQKTIADASLARGDGGEASWATQITAGLSLITWLAIAVCGRFIAYFMG
ncbi:hypothetical protein [Phenylobacterium sp.]|jgi:uncharacterized membrane protein|uniref:hypothetical protein n=1 Tax=Phenylobacterium sp. TaxID=1871053 RepID=UPI002E3636A5|nr:hypothetical protein [Phenylobacterium sp.]HEX3366344.1 hypothetical protein [Phenylobacterium sp.]